MNNSFLSFIVKDISNCSDNLLNINYNKTFDITCTCGVNFCDHSDYVIKCVSNCIHHDINFNEKNYILIGFKDDECIRFHIKDIMDNYIHHINLSYHDDSFHLTCDCHHKMCKSSEYALLSFLLRYGENKQKQTIQKIEQKTIKESCI